MYGWMCLPWMVLQGFLYPLLMHLPPTGYNALGEVCPLATAKERMEARNRRWFAAGDANKDGKLDFEELCYLLRNTGCSEEELLSLFEQLDMNKDGLVDRKEFRKVQSVYAESRIQKLEKSGN